jgi:signal peptide peptidase SppA
MKYPRIVHAFYNTPLAIMPEKAMEIERFIALIASGVDISDNEKEDAVASSAFPPTGNHDETLDGPSVGVVPIIGTLTNRARAFSSGGSNYQTIASNILALSSEESVSSILLDIDSPGGAVNGISSVISAIHHAQSKGKEVVAVANDMMASAAYWIGSQADRIVVSPSSTIGSIGVIAVHTEFSKYDAEKGITSTVIKSGEHKGIGNEYEPLTDTGKAVIQSELDRIHAGFKSDVNDGRFSGKANEEKMSKLSQGDVWIGSDAIAVELADSVGSLHQTITSAMSTKASTPEDSVAAVGDERFNELSATVASLAESVASLTSVVTSQVEAAEADRKVQTQRNAERMVEEAIDAGKFLPASRDTLVEQAVKNPDSFASIAASIAPNSAAPLEDNVTPKGQVRVPSADDELSEEETEVFGQLGLLNAEGKVDLSGTMHAPFSQDNEYTKSVNSQLGLA